MPANIGYFTRVRNVHLYPRMKTYRGVSNRGLFDVPEVRKGVKVDGQTLYKVREGYALCTGLFVQ